MTAKSPRGLQGSDGEPELAAADEGVTEPAAKPAARKKARRVRVIEILDDEDLDDVLEALDEEAEEEEEPAPAPGPATVKAAKPAAKRPPVREAAQDEEDASAEEPAPAPAKAVKADPEPARGVRSWQPGGFPVLTVVAVVLIAVLATLTIVMWRSAGGATSKEDTRREVARVAGEYGDAALSYDAANYKTQLARTEKLLGGDLLANFRTNTVPNLGQFFAKNPQVTLTSKIQRVYVGDINGNLATAVILVDIKVQSAQGATDGSNTLLRLSLAKDKSGWHVTQQAASGQSDQEAATGGGPSVPSGGTTPSAPAKKP